MRPPRWLLLPPLLLAACTGDPPEEPQNPDRDPALDVLTEELELASLYQLHDARAALAGKDDLRSIDRRRALDLASHNRSPAQVDPDLPADFPAEHREREQTLRRAWQTRHLAFSWDNLDAEAQLEPRPETLSLTWLVLAHYLPLARNKQPFEIPWVRDYFERKSWYVPQDGPLYLSYLDKVQMERIETEIAAITPHELEDWVASLPLPGMSAAEARIEARLANRLLTGGTVFEEPTP